MADIGIIGGADGPTAILVTKSIFDAYSFSFALGLGLGLIIAVATGFIVYFAAKKKFDKNN